jgi:hypothetical protein
VLLADYASAFGAVVGLPEPAVHHLVNPLNGIAGRLG